MSSQRTGVLPAAILGTGSVTGSAVVTSEALDERFGRSPGTTRARSGVRSRFWAGAGETSSGLAAAAVEKALAVAGRPELDALIVASVLPEQPMPTNAMLVLGHLGTPGHRTVAFDVNTSCLGFLTGLELAALGVAAGRWRHVAVAAVDLASAGLDHDDLESSALFGDGAAAVVLGPAPSTSTGPAILAARFETHPDGARLCQIAAGGTRWNVAQPPPSSRDYYFHMDGLGLMRTAAKHLPGLVDGLLADAALSLADIDVVIPHQASGLGLRFLRERMGVPAGKVVDILHDHGNQVSASLPTALDHAVRGGRFSPGKTALLIGTGAGVVLGGMVVRW